MKIIKDYTEESAYTFLRGKSNEEIEEIIDKAGCDENLINTELLKEYPKKDYFVLVDYIDDGNNGYFHIRIWGYGK